MLWINLLSAFALLYLLPLAFGLPINLSNIGGTHIKPRLGGYYHRWDSQHRSLADGSATFGAFASDRSTGNEEAVQLTGSGKFPCLHELTRYS